jgi:hypothetical protein
MNRSFFWLQSLIQPRRRINKKKIAFECAQPEAMKVFCHAISADFIGLENVKTPKRQRKTPSEVQ